MQILLIVIILNVAKLKNNAELSGDTEADGNGGVLKNATIAVPLKYLSDFLRSVEMPQINCKIKLKLKLTKWFVCNCSWW